MQIYPENITFIIVCFKSEKVIFSCLNSLPRDSYKLIIENSNNFKLKKELEGRYKNLEVIINNQNSGFGASNNLGIKKSRSEFILADLLLLFVSCASVPKLPETCAIKILSYKSIYTLITDDNSRRAGIYFTCIGAI